MNVIRSSCIPTNLVMARGQQKAESQRKNALKKAKDAHKGTASSSTMHEVVVIGSQLAGQKAALKMTCPQCMVMIILARFSLL